MSLSIVILAAGKGERMRSSLPKALHLLAGRPLLAHVIAAARELPHRKMYVVRGADGEPLQARFPDPQLAWIEQAQPLGTGHAVARALEAIPAADQVLVLYGDAPLIAPATLKRLTAAGATTGDGLAILTCEVADPTGYGRIVRGDDGAARAIVEERDATDAQRAITEINSGLLAAAAKPLRRWLAEIGNANAQREYYLTDIVAAAAAEGVPIATVAPGDPREIQGVNDRLQLAALERHYQLAQAQELMRRGVTLLDPARFDCRGEIECGRDVSIDINAVLEGKVRLGDHVQIGPNCQLRDAALGAHVIVKANSVIEEARIGAHCVIGPFARIRPDTELAERVSVGNFVEIKKSRVRRESKINHLAYVGDSEVGAEVNIGAGAITCNYDGARKHKTVIGDHVFIGSNSQLIAPVTIGDHATVAAGATVSKDVAAASLEYSKRTRGVIENWRRPKKQ